MFANLILTTSSSKSGMFFTLLNEFSRIIRFTNCLFHPRLHSPFLLVSFPPVSLLFTSPFLVSFLFFLSNVFHLCISFLSFYLHSLHTVPLFSFIYTSFTNFPTFLASTFPSWNFFLSFLLHALYAFHFISFPYISFLHSLSVLSSIFSCIHCISFLSSTFPNALPFFPFLFNSCMNFLYFLSSSFPNAFPFFSLPYYYILFLPSKISKISLYFVP